MLKRWWSNRRAGMSRSATSRGAALARLASDAATALFTDERPDSAFESTWRLVVRKRTLMALAFVAVWAVAVEARLVQLQVFQHDKRMAEAVRQQENVITPEAPRGDIVDRNGRLLAYSVAADSVVADPTLVVDPDATAAAICGALRDCTKQERADLRHGLAERKRFLWIRHSSDVSPAQAQRVAALALPGVMLQSDSRRYYPLASEAVHAIGFVDQDNHGKGGVEYSYDKTVRGEPGLAYVQFDARRERLETRIARAPVPGATLELTLDVNLQHIAERELKAGVEASRARGGTAIIMDPHTGEVLALANWPTFNPNVVGQSSDAERTDRAVAYVYEPGSTFKIVTASAALEGHVVTPQEMIDTNPGSIKPAGRSRPIYDTHPHGVIPFEEVIVLSSNVGAVKVGLRTGAAQIGRYVERFGFGHLMAPDLPGGSRGIWNPSGLTESGLASVSMGYQIGVTPMQMITAASAVANGGLLMEPHVVRAVVRDGVRTPVAPKVLRRAIEPDTAAMLTTMMEGVVARGTATLAQIGGYPAAGKTGTANKVVDGRYSPSDFNASFVAFVPSQRPEFTILVVIDTPTVGSHFGGGAAGPVFKRIAEAALQARGVPSPLAPAPLMFVRNRPTPLPLPLQRTRTTSLTPTMQPAGGPALMPDVRGLSAREAMRVLGRAGLSARVSGSGFVVRQSPQPGLTIEAGGWAGVDLQRADYAPASGEATP
jgi:cell division protein FtsI (penicillin-binding protein 3)